MLPNYITVTVFFILSVAVPALTLLGSQLMRKTTSANEVSTLNYESAEETIGGRIAIMKEYIYYFSMFLALELVVAMLLIWVFAAAKLPESNGFLVLGLVIMAFVFEVLVMLISRREVKQ